MVTTGVTFFAIRIWTAVQTYLIALWKNWRFVFYFNGIELH